MMTVIGTPSSQRMTLRMELGLLILRQLAADKNASRKGLFPRVAPCGWRHRFVPFAAHHEAPDNIATKEVSERCSKSFKTSPCAARSLS